MLSDILPRRLHECLCSPKFAMHRRLVLLGGAFLLATGLIVAGSLFLYGKWKARQVRILTERAENYHSQARMTEARMSWETALRLNPNDPRALAGMARWHEQAGASFDALYTWQRLAESGGMSPGDAASYLQTALREGEEDVARTLANSLAGAGDRAIPHLVQAEFHSRKGDLDSAEKELHQAAERDATPRSRMLLALQLLRTGRGAEAEKEGIDLLREITPRDDEAGLHVVRELLASRRISLEETEKCLERLRSHPLAHGDHHLLADFHALSMWPDRREAILSAASERLGKSSARDRAGALPWMLQVGGPALAMPMLSAAEASANRSVFPIWLQAHALGGRWDAVLEACESPAAPVPLHMRHLYRGRALAKLGRMEESRAAYAAAQAPEARTSESVADIPAYLLLAGEEALFTKAFLDALESNTSVEPLFQKIVTTARQLGDARRLREIYRMAERHPALSGNPSLQNDAAHLDLLMRVRIDQQTTARRLRENPQDFAMRSTHALALLESGSPREALETLSGGDTETRLSTLPFSHQALIAAILAASGNVEEAQKIVASLPPSALLVQERELLARHMPVTNAEPPATTSQR